MNRTVQFSFDGRKIRPNCQLNGIRGPNISGMSRLARFLIYLASSAQTARQLASHGQYVRPVSSDDIAALAIRDSSSLGSRDALRALEVARRVCESSAPPGA
jgi:hypothetical protein